MSSSSSWVSFDLDLEGFLFHDGRPLFEISRWRCRSWGHVKPLATLAHLAEPSFCWRIQMAGFVLWLVSKCRYNHPARGTGLNPLEGGCFISDALLEVYHAHSMFVCRTFLFSNLISARTFKFSQKSGHHASETWKWALLLPHNPQAPLSHCHLTKQPACC